MGCLNSDGKFEHVFGNIHLSGPCNRSCYFCIGQHMMDLDKYNNLNKFPLEGLSEFTRQCKDRKIEEVYLTGSNTDPSLYQFSRELRWDLYGNIPTLRRFGLRTNGVAIDLLRKVIPYFDKLSVSIGSLDPEVNCEIMGGPPPDLAQIRQIAGKRDMKVNVLLTSLPQKLGDIVSLCGDLGITRVNVREIYGQPNIGDPFASHLKSHRSIYGMPCYMLHGVEVTYWDVHYVEVESINLFASGRVSSTYPISKGHSDNGIVLPQSSFEFGRHTKQWRSLR